MKYLIMPFLLLMINGCSVYPEDIRADIDKCKKYDLYPVIHMRLNYVTNVSCIPGKEEGYIFAEHDLKLIPEIIK